MRVRQYPHMMDEADMVSHVKAWAADRNMRAIVKEQHHAVAIPYESVLIVVAINVHGLSCYVRDKGTGGKLHWSETIWEREGYIFRAEPDGGINHQTRHSEWGYALTASLTKGYEEALWYHGAKSLP